MNTARIICLRTSISDDKKGSCAYAAIASGIFRKDHWSEKEIQEVKKK